MNVLLKKIIERDGKFLVTDDSGDQVLGEHDTRDEANEQLRAIEDNKNASLLRIEVKGGEVFVTGPISTTELDQGNDVVTEECLKDMKGQIDGGNIKLDIDHERWEKSDKAGSHQPLGRAVTSWIVKQGDTSKLMVKWLLNKTHPQFKEMVEQIKTKFYDGFSIAYVVKNFVNDVSEKIRFLKSIILKNVAITAYPMNLGCSDAQVTTKSLHGLKTVFEDQIKEASEMEDEEKKKLEAAEKKKKEEAAKAEEEVTVKRQDLTKIVESVDELKKELHEFKAAKEPQGDEAIAEKMVKVRDEILAHPLMKAKAEELKTQKDLDSLEELKKTSEALTELLKSPAVPPAGDQMPTEKKTVEGKEEQPANILGLID